MQTMRQARIEEAPSWAFSDHKVAFQRSACFQNIVCHCVLFPEGVHSR